jgi:hypothetical protein
VGPKHRAHVFTPDAKHVTSVVMNTVNVQKRLQQGRWRPADPEERGEFRLQLKARFSRGEGSADDTREPSPPIV